jgi:N-acyl-phosphatidylethanolamine-hydrolysing phospholipase D
VDGVKVKFRVLSGALIIVAGIWMTVAHVGTRGIPTESHTTHHHDGGFRNPWPTFSQHSFGDFLYWVLIDRRRSKLEPRPSYVPKVLPNAADSLRAASDHATITWIGHSTVLVRIGGITILTDPMWSDRASPVSWAGPKRFTPPGIAFDDLPDVDVVLISHNHYDHLDAGTIRMLGDRPTYLVPLGVGNAVKRFGAGTVHELDWWETMTIGDVILTCTPAQHFASRSPFDGNKSLWCGWTMRGTDGAVYFAGDTGPFPEFASIGERLGPFDVACLPIGAYLPAWFMGPVHTGPRDVISALEQLRGRTMLAIHHGSFKLADDPPGLAASELVREVSSRGLDPDRYLLLSLGETRNIRPRTGTASDSGISDGAQ